MTISYSGVWGPGSNWDLLAWPPVSTDQTFDAWLLFPLPLTITAEVFDVNGLNPVIIEYDLDVVFPPSSPTLAARFPDEDVCEGVFVSATFNSSGGGVECTDEYQYFTRSGGIDSGPFPYVEGDPIFTGGIDEVWIQGQRSNCHPNSGCDASGWDDLAHWNVGVDSEPPVITDCAPDRTLGVDADCEFVIPDLTGEVVFTELCDTDPAITQVPAAGTVVGIGLTTVTITVTDAGGNYDDCASTITVIDDTSPLITGCPTDFSVPADAEYCGTTVSWTEPVATDNCSGVGMSSNHSPGDFFPVGITTVTYIATDGAGLTASCSFDVEVLPAPDPVISGPDPVCTPGLSTYEVPDPGSHTFLWTVSNGIIIGSDTNVSVDVEWTGTVQGTVSVQITSGSGCSISNSKTVNKNHTPDTGIISSSSSLTRR